VLSFQEKIILGNALCKKMSQPTHPPKRPLAPPVVVVIATGTVQWCCIYRCNYYENTL